MESTTTRPYRATGKLIPSGDVPQYKDLLQSVKREGLLSRTYGFYGALTGTLVLALAGTLTGMVFAGASWWQLPIGIILAVVFTQLAFLGHEASHRQVFTSKKANDQFGRLVATLLVGISYSWWMNKHTRHHANPNQVAHDPDIDSDVLAFQPEQAEGKGKLHSWFLKHQGTFFFPLLFLEGLNLHVQGLRYILDRRNPVQQRSLEITFLAVRLIGLPLLIFSTLPPLAGVGVLAVQLGFFGLYMGASFAPNHKGMPQVPAELKLSFFHKQVLTSRNIIGKGMTAVFGGLNYQIEHHLFPSMPRPHLARAAQIVKDYCARFEVPYTAVTATESYRAVIRYLNSVGRADRDLFACPLVLAYGRK